MNHGILPPPRLLAAGRVLAGLTQRELATAAGLSTTTIARYESGAATMRTDTLGTIVAVLRGMRVRFVGESQEAELGLLLLKEERSNPTTRNSAE